MDKLNEGEFLCNKCDGLGNLPLGNTCETPEGEIYHTIQICDKCQGTGKLDWIENIVGKRSRMFSANWGIETGMGESYFSNDVIEEYSKHIRDQIDKDIMKSYTGEWNE